MNIKFICYHLVTLKQKSQLRILLHKLISLLFFLRIIFGTDQFFELPKAATL